MEQFPGLSLLAISWEKGGEGEGGGCTRGLKASIIFGNPIISEREIT